MKIEKLVLVLILTVCVQSKGRSKQPFAIEFIQQNNKKGEQKEKKEKGEEWFLGLTNQLERLE